MAGRRGSARHPGNGRFNPRRLMQELGESAPSDATRVTVGPQTAKLVAAEAAKELDLSAGETTREVTKHARRIVELWKEKDAPQKAARFWQFSENAEKHYGFYRGLHPLASGLVVYAAVKDLAAGQPLQGIGGEFDPDRQKAVILASASLVSATVGGIDAVRALEAPVPDDLVLVRDDFSRSGTRQFPDRLETYDEVTLHEYLQARGLDHKGFSVTYA